MQAALAVPQIESHFISTDDERLKQLGSENGFTVIDRPDYLATSEAKGDDAYKHGFEVICEMLGKEPDVLVLLFCNAPTVRPSQILEGIRLLDDDKTADSAVTVSEFNMYSPIRARRIDDDGYLQPFIPFENYLSPDEISCDRNSQGSVLFADVALSVIRSQNLKNLESGLMPQPWMGKKILPIRNEAGLDIDFEWQLGQVNWWLENRLN